jgi:sugar/nucleoside kinase (ribokinase family)
MSKAFKIAVLGPIPRDYITTYQNDVVEKYGCVIYPVVALSRLVSEGSRIVPVTHVRKIDQAPIKQILSSFHRVDPSHVTADADQGDVIRLKYVDQNRRIERQTAFMNPIVPDDLKELLEFDAFVFVPVTDFEISLNALQYLKSNSQGVVIFDAHGPTNTCTRRGERFLKFWIDRDLWLPYIDILKMNLEEAGCSWFAREYDPQTLKEDIKLPLDELPKFARHCLSFGVKALYVTLDEYGCALYFKNPRGKVEEHFIKGIQVDKVVDTTGCGDSFAGGLAFGYLKTRDFIKACYYGNAMGAQRCTGTELAIYKDIEETERQIVGTYSYS